MLRSVLDTAAAGLDPQPELKVLVPGREVAWDNSCGQLWVRVESVESLYAQTRSGGSAGNCPIGVRMTLGVGIIRCVSTLNDNGDPPTENQITADGMQGAIDASALYKALQCFTPVNAESSRLMGWNGQGPLGGTGGGEWLFQVRMNNSKYVTPKEL